MAEVVERDSEVGGSRATIISSAALLRAICLPASRLFVMPQLALPSIGSSMAALFHSLPGSFPAAVFAFEAFRNLQLSCHLDFRTLEQNATNDLANSIPDVCACQNGDGPLLPLAIPA